MRVECVSCGQGVVGVLLSNPYICDSCMQKYYKIKDALKEKDEINKDEVLVVYAYSEDGHPWIEGIYRDTYGAFQRMQRFQESDEYGYLTWSNQRFMIGWEDPYRELFK